MDPKWNKGLKDDFKNKLFNLEALLYENGMKYDPTEGYRSPERQNALYAQGRTKPGKKVTNAKAYQSAHNLGCALDVIPVVKGKRTYNPPPGWWEKFGRCVVKVGLAWGGNFKSITDKPHVELPGWQKYYHPEK